MVHKHLNGDTSHPNWLQLLQPIGNGGKHNRFDDGHLFRLKWLITNSRQYLILAERSQTFPLGETAFGSQNGLSGLVTNRMAHTQLVVEVGRLLGQKVGLDISYEINSTMTPDEVKTWGHMPDSYIAELLGVIPLPHDMGSPPFAHQGEHAFRTWASDPDKTYILRWLRPEKWKDLMNYDSNAYALHALMEMGDVTYPVSAGIAKYPHTSSDESKHRNHKTKFGILAEDAGNFRWIADTLGLTKYDRGTAYFIRHFLVYLLEAADDIGYFVHDFRDALKQGRYKLEMSAKQKAKPLTGKIKEILEADNIEQLYSYVTGENFGDAPDAETESSPAEKLKRLAHMEAHVIEICTDMVAEAFKKHKDEILNGEYRKNLLEDCILPNGRPFGPVHKACRANFHNTVIGNLSVVEAQQKTTIINMMDLFAMAYFTRQERQSYLPTSSHQISREITNATNIFLKKLGSSEAKLLHYDSFDVFIGDAIHWLTQQGDKSLLALHGSLLKDQAIKRGLQTFRSYIKAESAKLVPGPIDPRSKASQQKPGT
jgi:dGTP triphosphohydrolase